MYNHAHGLYADTWSAWTELVINIAVTVIAGYLWGIAGILLGKIISTGIIIVLWKPYYLFHSGLQLPYKNYWYGATRNFLVSMCSFGIVHIIIKQIRLNAFVDFGSWILYCITGILIYLSINISLTLLLCNGVKDILKRLHMIG